MAENPVLIDLSGNGHDATCYNFAWSKMSGIGGYNINLPTLWNPTEYKCHVTQDSNYSNSAGTGQINSISFKFKISNYIGNGRTGLTIRALSVDGNSTILKTDTFASDGEYEFSYNSDAKFNVILYNRNPSAAISDFSYDLELLPLYPNALVSDGVNDYCLVEGLPLLNKEDGYTVIVKRKYISQDSRNAPLLAKYMGADNNGAFQFERSITNSIRYANSFGVATAITFSQEDIVYQTHDTYNGESIGVGKGEDTNYLNIFTRDRINNGCIMCAFYSLLLFNRDLTTDEIEWVKTNLIEGD